MSTADVDGDGDMDVLSASGYDNKVAWYQNGGSGDFGPQLIISDMAIVATCVHAADLNGDGNIDVLSTSMGDDRVVWYTNLNPLSLDSPEIAEPVGVFPNPIVESAIIDVQGMTGTVTIEIIDLQGKVARSETVNISQGALTIERGHLSPGQYLLRLSNADWQSEVKFLVEYV